MGLPQRTNQASWRGSLWEGCRTPAATNISPRTAAGVRKPPRDETAGRGTYWAVPRAQLWRFGRGRATAEIGSAVGSAGCDGVAAQMRPGWTIPLSEKVREPGAAPLAPSTPLTHQL